MRVLPSFSFSSALLAGGPAKTSGSRYLFECIFKQLVIVAIVGGGPRRLEALVELPNAVEMAKLSGIVRAGLVAYVGMCGVYIRRIFLSLT